MAWEPTQFEGIAIKVLYENKDDGEMTCFLKWEPGATLPMHKHREIEQTYVIEGSFYDHDGICRAANSFGGAWDLFTRLVEVHSARRSDVTAQERQGSGPQQR